MTRQSRVTPVVFLTLIVCICAAPSFAQLQSTSGKSWKFGSAIATDFVQVTVTQGQASQIAGTVSIRTDGLWQGTKVKQFSGRQKAVANFVRFDCTADDGIKFSGWYWPGASGGRGDDRIALYFRPSATLTETEPDCHPDKRFIAVESDTEPVD